MWSRWVCGDQPGRRAHEVPRLGAEVEADLQLRDAPVGLHRGPRVALDGQAGVLAGQERSVIDHVRRTSEATGARDEGEGPFTGLGRAAVVDPSFTAGRGARGGAGRSRLHVLATIRIAAPETKFAPRPGSLAERGNEDSSDAVAAATRLAVLMFLQSAFPTLLPLYSVHLEKRLGFPSLTVGVCGAARALGTVLVALFAGQAADRWFAAKACVAVCSLFAGVLLLLLTTLTEPLAVFLTTLAFWAMAAPVMMLGTSICFRQFDPPERDYSSALWAPSAGSPPAWLLLRDGANCRPRLTAMTSIDQFRLGSAFAFVLAVYALTLPRTPPLLDGKRKAAPLAALRLLRGRAFAVYCACTFGVCVTFSFSTQATPLLLGRLGVPREWLGPTQTLAQVSEVAALMLLPMFLLRLGLRGTMLFGLAAWAAAMTILAVGRPLGLVVGSFVFNGLCVSGFLVAGQVFVNRHASDDVRASVQALLTFVNAAGMLLGHLLVGYLRWLHDGGLPQAFGVAAAITGAILLLFAVGFRERDRIE